MRDGRIIRGTVVCNKEGPAPPITVVFVTAVK